MHDFLSLPQNPYPELTVYNYCPNDVCALTDDYAGRASETTAVMQYSYQSYILKEDYPDIANTLEEIAIAEMRHHELLAKAIVASGGNPVIAGTRCFWSGNFVNYATDVKKILCIDLEAERQAICNYQQTIQCLQNKSIIQLIERIICDEKAHAAIFEQLIEQLDCH